MNEKKKYEKPEAEVVDFFDQDIITLSQGDMAGLNDGEELL